MATYAELRAAIDSTGIWRGGREESHGFVVSPDVYELTHANAELLAELARATNNCLLGASRLMAIAADSSLAGHAPGYTRINRLLGRGTLYGLGASIRPGALPILRKVDIVPGADGNLWIAEIDATNPRSLGYSLLGRALVQTIRPAADTLCGVVPFLVEQLQRRKVQELTFLYGHTQRFYAPEFAILARELLGHGIVMHVLDEDDIVMVENRPTIAKTGYALPSVFVDFPPMNHNKPLINWLTAAAKAHAVQFLVPPKHFLSSKALLAVLSNATGNETIERLLLTQIEAKDLATLRRHLPPTFVIDETLPAGKPYGHMVLKKAVSSGMRGVTFGGTRRFADELQMARRAPGQFVLQQRVQPASFRFASYTAQGNLEPAKDWFLRLTAYFSYRGVEDVAVTARTDVRVHGASDAILTGTVVV
jgi:hypothetical protein